jgi:hypothetical protein
MECRSVAGLTLFYDAGEESAADLIGGACEESVRLIGEHWGLAVPEECRVYVMTSWLRFFFHSAPWHWRILLALLPVWIFRVRRTWPIAAGWTQAYGKRRAVGVKPPRLQFQADRSVGERVFVHEEDMDENVRRVTCHELVHAFTAHLKLPIWLHEGLASATVDLFAGQPTIEHRTLEALDQASSEADPRGNQRVSVRDPVRLVAHFVRGYWVTRYLDDTEPELLRSLLLQRTSHRELESKVAAAYNMEQEEFWRRIDGLVVSHFGAA